MKIMERDAYWFLPMPKERTCTRVLTWMKILTTATTKITPQASLEKENQSLAIYPNPASQSFVINFTEVQEGVKQVRVMDMLGKEVMSLENPSGNTINIANLPTGMYVVRVLGQGGKEYAVKLVKE